ncbi:uncharacterized protein BDV17DRAFT_271592 [Aspergillus undulatus]|uniref:uncharacterized protein n=1 Tax=Aspergillus undulatus TaxID=1810928 RepID=UPI003CCD329F
MARYPPDSNAPAVIVLTRFLLVTSILGTLARLATKWWKFGTFFRDDYYALSAMLASIAQAIAVSIAVAKGYGRPITHLSDNQVDGVLKAQYTATIFYILGIALSQLSFLCFVQYLASRNNRSFTAQQLAIAVVAVVGIFGSAFQCRAPQWDYLHGRCFNREAWYIYLAASMIIVEIGIIAQAVIVMVKVQTPWKRKSNLMAVFLFRVVVPAALISQAILIHNTITSPDATSSTWSTTICTQLALCLSVVTASTPQFVPILRRLQSTGMRLDGMTRYTVNTSNAQDSRSRSRSRSKHLFSFSQRRAGSGTAGDRDRDQDSVLELDHIPIVATKTTVTGGYPLSPRVEEEREPEDRGSQSSSSQAGIIRETRTFIVTEEHVQSQR